MRLRPGGCAICPSTARSPASPPPEGEVRIAPADHDEDEELADLVRRAAAGEQEAFAALYDRTGARVHGIALRLLCSPDLAADVTQEVFVDVWFQASRFDRRRGTVVGWMLTMAHRRAVELARARRGQRGWALEEVQETSTEGAWARLEVTLEAGYVRTALRSLSTEQRETLYLTYLCGYGSAETAQLIGVPPATIQARIREGLARLSRQTITYRHPGAAGPAGPDGPRAGP